MWMVLMRGSKSDARHWVKRVAVDADGAASLVASAVESEGKRFTDPVKAVEFLELCRRFKVDGAGNAVRFELKQLE